MLEVNNLSKYLGNRKILKGINIEIGNGVHGLLGSNGAGKTTLMRCLCRLYRIDEGSISLNKRNIESLKKSYFNQLGYLPQNFGYYPDFTAYEFLSYLSVVKGVPKDIAQGRIDTLLKELGLFEKRNDKLKSYSGGMLRRIGIAQSLLNEPTILILDEPTAGLDPKERIHLKNLLNSYGEEHIVLVSTHIVSDIEDIAKSIIILKDGKVCASGTLDSLLEIIKGHVYEGWISRIDLSKILTKYRVRNVYEEGEKVRVRLLCDDIVDDGFKAIKPTLNDLYLYYFDEVSKDE